MDFNRRWSAEVGTEREEIAMHHFKFQLVVCAGIMPLISGVASAQQDFINNFAGGGPNNVPATSANVTYPDSTATDSAGNFYIVSANQHRVFKVNSSGILTVLAGNGFAGYGGDGGPATQAELYLNTFSRVAVDSAGNAYIADSNNCVVRIVSAGTGIISTFAGTPGHCAFNGDGNPATAAGTYLYYPYGVAVDSAGNVYISDVGYDRIRQVNTSGTINTVAGNGTYCSSYPCGDGGPATSASLGSAFSLAVDGAGNVFIPDVNNDVVRELNVSTGNISLVAGTYGTYCFQSGSSSCGDGGPATSAGFYYIYGIASDARGNLFIADFDNYDIREVYCADSAVACTAPAGFTAGDIYTVAGTGGTYGNSGDGGSATNATLGYAYGVAVDSSDDIFIPSYDYQVVREVTASTGTINTVAGNGTFSYTGNNIPATDAVLNNPWGVAFDSAGNAYIADRYNCIVRKVDTSGVITLFAGTVGTCGFGGDGGSATATGAYLSYPSAVATDSAGNVYIADVYNLRIRKVDTGGNISTFAGDGSYGFDGDGAATSHSLYYPQAVATDAAGNVYIADTDNYRIRKVDTSGNMTTIAGNGTYGFSGDGGPATNATMTYPVGVAVDKAGNVYFTDTNNLRVRQINTADIIATYAGNGAYGFGGDGGFATQTSLYYPEQVAVDPAGDVIIADTSNQRIRLVDGQGRIHTVAGNGYYGYYGPEENVLATTAELANPIGVGVDSSGNIYIGDTNNNLVREVSAVAVLNASRTNVVFNVQSVGTTSGSQSLTLTAAGPLSISSITTTGPFTEADDCGGGPPSGTSCTMNIVFKPTTSGTFTGTVTISDNGFFNTSLVIYLTGYGTAVKVTPTSLSFLATAVGSTSAPKTVTLTNNGPNPLTMNSVSTKGDFFVSSSPCASPIAHGGTCSISVEFKPTQNGTRTGSLIISDSDGSSPQLVSLTGTGIGASLSPSTTTFATQVDGTTSAKKIITLINHTTSTITSLTPGFTGTNAGYFSIVSGGTCGSSLAGSASCTYFVAFTPSAQGAETATFNVTDSDGTQTAALKGTATEVGLSPPTLAFGTVTSSKTLSVTVTNEGTTPLTVSAATVTGTGAANFAVVPYDGNYSTCLSGTPVNQFGTCTITVTFTNAGGTTPFTTNLNIFDNGGGSPQLEKMTAKD
jgi:NHL repeat